MAPATELIVTAISIIAAFGAFAAWIVRHMDRRFAEAKADTQRQFAEMQRQFTGVQQQFAGVQQQFAEAKADTQRQFAEMQRQFTEAKADTQRQFAEAKADTQRQFSEMQQQFAEARADTQQQFSELRAEMHRGFDQAREDRLRLEEKMEGKLDAHGEQIANLRQDIGRLQGIVERTWQPRRFPVLSAQQEVGAGDEVRDTRMSYGAGHEGEDSGHGSEDVGHGGENPPPGSEDTGRNDTS